MKNDRKSFFIKTLFLIVAITLVSYLYGFRFTPLKTIKSNIKKEANIFKTLECTWGNIYLIKESSGFKTIAVKRYGLLWKISNSCFYKNTSDSVKTIGWLDDHNYTFYAVLPKDKNITYIKIGPENDRIRKDIKKNNDIIIFHWKKPIPWNKLNGVCYDNNNKPIYKFKYPQNTTITTDDLKWYSSLRQ
ncbi:hypothetical protein C3495_14550 (plasmid) [Clostridiaceae bacterium 14S0207]|nr:hypothetical protein C3495_14550 [Clostridiaceae bacterium 14S0207]